MPPTLPIKSNQVGRIWFGSIEMSHANHRQLALVYIYFFVLSKQTHAVVVDHTARSSCHPARTMASTILAELAWTMCNALCLAIQYGPALRLIPFGRPMHVSNWPESGHNSIQPPLHRACVRLCVAEAFFIIARLASLPPLFCLH